jgi:hypothetical protein
MVLEMLERLFYNGRVSELLAPDGTKRCGQCGEIKALTEFHRRGEGRQWYCIPCRKEWDAAYWLRRREHLLELRRDRTRRLKDWVRELKSSQPCEDCGGRFHWAAMTYDHLPGHAKRGNVSDLTASGYRGVLINEIAKCDLVCANCHALRTYIRTLGIEPTQPSICEPPTFYSLNATPLN